MHRFKRIVDSAWDDCVSCLDVCSLVFVLLLLALVLEEFLPRSFYVKLISVKVLVKYGISWLVVSAVFHVIRLHISHSTI